LTRASLVPARLQQAPVAALAQRASKKRKETTELAQQDFTSNTAVSASAVGSMTAGKKTAKGAGNGKGAKRAKKNDEDDGTPATAEASGSGSGSNAPAAEAPVPAKKEPKKSTAVYVSGLPLDVTASELASVFSKCGILLLGPSDEPRIKLYSDEAGKPKGEALVMYFKESSVELAERVMDDTEFRLGQGGRMRVRRAEWGDGGGAGEEKKEGGGGGEGEKGKGKEKKRMTEEEKRALHARMRKMESSVALIPSLVLCRSLCLLTHPLRLSTLSHGQIPHRMGFRLRRRRQPHPFLLIDSPRQPERPAGDPSPDVYARRARGGRDAAARSQGGGARGGGDDGRGDQRPGLGCTPALLCLPLLSCRG